MRTVQYLFKLLILVNVSFLYLGCGGGGGSASATPDPIFENRDVILYAGCPDSICNNYVLFTYNPQTDETASVVGDFVPDGLDEAIVHDGKVYFEGDSATAGEEVWVFDPLAEINLGVNPSMLRDINPGTANANPRDFMVFNDKIYFQAVDSTTGLELYVYDPVIPTSATNPGLVYDLNPGTNHSYPYGLVALNNKLYFTATNGTNGYELFVYDPSVAASATNPLMVYDYRAGSGSSNPDNITIVGDKLYYRASNLAAGQELVVLDTAQAFGASNPSLVYDLNTGGGDGCSSIYSVQGSKIYFRGLTAGEGAELFVFDTNVAASGSNPQIIYDINPGVANSSISSFTVLNDKMYFRANDGTNGHEVYIYNPAQASSATNPLLIDINPTGNSYPYNFKSSGDAVYFVANDGVNGEELWHLDTAAAMSSSNPSILLDMNSSGSSNPEYYVIGSDGNFYFSAYTASEGQEFWSLDPLAAFDSSNPVLRNNLVGTGEIYPEYLLKFTYTVEIEQ